MPTHSCDSVPQSISSAKKRGPPTQRGCGWLCLSYGRNELYWVFWDPLSAPLKDVQLLCENQHLFKTHKDRQDVCFKSTDTTYCGDLCKEVILVNKQKIMWNAPKYLFQKSWAWWTQMAAFLKRKKISVSLSLAPAVSWCYRKRMNWLQTGFLELLPYQLVIIRLSACNDISSHMFSPSRQK